MSDVLKTTARLSDDGKKIILQGYSPELIDFYRTLPNARFDRRTETWSCLATPVTAWRVASRIEEIEGTQLSLMVGDFRDRLAASKDTSKRDQPTLRKTDAWEHQVKAYWFAVRLKSAMLALDMGTGKSKVVIDIVVNAECRKVLVICPTSVRGVWRGEFEKHSPIPWSMTILEKGAVKKRTAAAARAMSGTGNPVCIVINYEAVWLEPFASWALGQEWDCLILDESHRIKSPTSHVSRYAARLGLKSERRLLLTGTPMPHSPLDIFAQYRVLDPGVFGTSWTQFRQRYSIHNNPLIPQQVTGYKNQAELNKRFAHLAYRVEADDVLDLPEVQHHKRTFVLSPVAQRAYRELEDELITEVEGGVVTAANALVKLLRLQQITSGYLVEDETKRETEVDDGKAKLLADLLDDFGPHEPVVVFCWFKHDLDRIREVAAKLKRRYGEVSGRHRDLTPEATMPADIDVLGVQVKSGGVGVDLTRARYCVCYSLGCISPGDYDQLLARIHRPGQERPVSYYHLIGENTVDVSMYRARRKRQDVIDAVLASLSRENTK